MSRNPCIALTLVMFAPLAAAQQAGVSSTVHNLSASGPGEIKALSETEVCKFCHIPHNPVEPVPLWSHALSRVEQYDLPKVRANGASERPPQPNGSSRLCLSCHDGTVAIGDLGQGRPEIEMAGARRLGTERRGHIGTDLSGSHPVSMRMQDEGPTQPSGRDMGLRPLSQVISDGDVRLDEAGRVQCTTCHDAHSDRYYVPGRVPRFWIRPTVDEVCLACHELR